MPRTSATLAAPGPYPVGFRTFAFVDASRPTPPNGTFAGAPTRTLTTVIFYPAAAGTEGSGAPVDADGAPFPALLWAHALSDTRIGERYLLEHLASHGYVVASPDFPLGRIGAPGNATANDLANQPGDLRFVLASLPAALPGAIDEERIGASGLSLGAITVLLTTYHPTLREPRLRAVLPVAPPYACALTRRFYRTTHVPLLVLQGDDDHMAPPEENGARAARFAHGDARLVEIHGGSHMGFVGFMTTFDQSVHFDRFGCDILLSLISDFSLPPIPDEQRAGISGDPALCPRPCDTPFVDPALPAARQQEITRLVETAFFDAFLRDDPAARCFLESGLATENADLTVTDR
ncbi:MAG TPA: hypothetical protein VKA21_02040 [Candidatus Binatia bacterium]|nr:hypothetical protein [Candidatus Binatia bacterium]